MFLLSLPKFHLVMAMAQGRYSEGQAARIMAEVASAVRFLHRNAIIHFDLVRALPTDKLRRSTDQQAPRVYCPCYSLSLSLCVGSNGRAGRVRTAVLLCTTFRG